MLKETYLNPKSKFQQTNFNTYRIDIPTIGVSNYGGTVILIHQKIIHDIQIHTIPIKYTIIHIQLNGKKL